MFANHNRSARRLQFSFIFVSALLDYESHFSTLGGHCCSVVYFITPSFIERHKMRHKINEIKIYRSAEQLKMVYAGMKLTVA